MESPTTTVGRKKLCRIVKKQSELTEGQTAVGTEDFGALMMGETSKETEDPSGESSAHDDSDYHSAGHSDVSRNVSSSSEATSADGEISRTTAATPCWDEEKSEISAKFLQLLDFSLRLGYTEAQLRCVLAKLGSSVLSGDSCPSQDKILGELIKLGQEVECDRRVVGANEKVSDPQPSTNVCPYGRKCTYGRKCRFNHPERCGTPMRSVTERLFEHHKKLSPSNSAEPDRPAAAASKELLCRSASNPPGLPSRFLNIPSCSQQQQRKKIAVMTNCLYPAALINHFQLKQLDDRKLGGGEMNRSPLAVIHPGYLSEQYGDANSHAILTRHVSNPEEILAAMRNRNGQQADLPPQMDSYWPHTGDLNGPTRRQPTEDLQSCLDGSSVLRGPIESSRRQQSALLAPDGYLSRSDTHLNLLRTGCSEEAQRWISGDRKSPLEEESLSGNYYMPSTKVKFIPVGMALRRAPMPLNMVTRRTFCNGRQHDSSRKGLVLGVYVGKDKSPHSDKDLTSAASSFNKRVGGKLIEQLNCSQPLTQGKSRVLYNLDTDLSAVSVVAIGEKGKQVNEAEGWHEGLENVRRAVARGVLDLREVGVGVVQVDSCGHSEAAAEGATLSLFSYDELKSKAESKAKFVDVKLYDGSDSIACANGWERGVKLARGQNLARRLMEMPANLLYPMAFAEMAVETLKPFQNVSVHVRNEAWARENKMFSFLSVGQGSDKPSVFLEIHAKSADSAASKKDPIVFVGKGVCFDSGGISLKPGGSMDKMRGDMGGAACAFSALHTICRLHGQSGIHRNLTVLIPLVENMPSGKAIKPGDIVKAMNGKSIKIDNTDAEGRLILADALCYAAKFSPAYIIDLATLTGAIHTALGSAATGVFTNSSSLWENIYQNSVATGDRVWRMPLFKHYSNKIKSDYADLNNIAKSNSGGGSCTAAAFLKEFVDCPNWAHMDIAGVMEDDGEIPYLRKGMTGSMPFLSLKEIVLWLGLTPFELFVQTVSFLIFTVLVALRTEEVISSSWYLIFTPLFAANGVSLYFTVIVFVRSYHEESLLKPAVARGVVVGAILGLLLVFQILLASNIANSAQTYGVVFTPLFILMGIVLVKTCQMNSSS